MTATPTNDSTNHPAPAATAEPAGQPAAPEWPDPKGLQIVLTTDTEAQTDDPVINPNNS